MIAYALRTGRQSLSYPQLSLGFTSLCIELPDSTIYANNANAIFSLNCSLTKPAIGATLTSKATENG